MKISNLGVEEFMRIVVRKLEELNHDIVLQNPQSNDTFPCGVVSNIMRSDVIRESATPVKSVFAVTVEWWTDKNYSSLALFDLASEKLREINILLTSNTTTRYDEVTKKYVVGGNYEVSYNGLTNSFQVTR